MTLFDELVVLYKKLEGLSIVIQVPLPHPNMTLHEVLMSGEVIMRYFQYTKEPKRNYFVLRGVGSEPKVPVYRTPARHTHQNEVYGATPAQVRAWIRHHSAHI